MWWDIVIAIIVGGMAAALYSAARSHRLKPTAVAVLFLAGFPGAWAGGLWLMPFGPPVAGLYILPFPAAGFLAFALASVLHTPPFPPRTRGEALREADELRDERRTVSIFLWLLLVVLTVLVVAGYLRPPRVGHPPAV